jgi:hypothetical protein
MNQNQKKLMKNLVQLSSLLILITVLSSCEAIAGIFKAGMGVGIFLVLLVVGIILFFVLRARSK